MVPDATLISNPFAALPIIAAPAILTNAASVLAMSTSNRFLRASERIRQLARQAEDAAELPEGRAMYGRQVERVQTQALLLLNGLGASYVAMASFAIASLVSIVGAALDARGLHGGAVIAVYLGLAAGFFGAGGLAHGCFNLFRATRLSMLNVSEEAAYLRRRRPGIQAAAPLADADQPDAP
jgi:hypothetical protein